MIYPCYHYFSAIRQKFRILVLEFGNGNLELENWVGNSSIAPGNGIPGWISKIRFLRLEFQSGKSKIRILNWVSDIYILGLEF